MTNAATTSPTHIEILGLIRELQSAAMASDGSQLGNAVQRLRDQLESHLAAEQPDQEPLPIAVKDALRSGQGRLLSMVANLQEEACRDSAKPCLVRVAELAALLRHQAHLEQRASRLVRRNDGTVRSVH